MRSGVSAEQEIDPEMARKAIVPSELLPILEEKDHFLETYYDEELEIERDIWKKKLGEVPRSISIAPGVGKKDSIFDIDIWCGQKETERSFGVHLRSYYTKENKSSFSSEIAKATNVWRVNLQIGSFVTIGRFENGKPGRAIYMTKRNRDAPYWTIHSGLFQGGIFLKGYGSIIAQDSDEIRFREGKDLQESLTS